MPSLPSHALRALAAAGLTLAGLVSAAGPASAQVIATDPAALQVAALDGTVVWVSGPDTGPQVLMQHTSAGDARVQGAPEARFYDSIDLGRDAKGALVLTYLRCTSATACTPYRDDLAGHRRAVAGLAPRGCRLTTAPALWGARMAYGLRCRRGSPALTGLYVSKAGGAPRALRLSHAVGAPWSVDLRQSLVGAIAERESADGATTYAFSQTVAGRRLRTFVTANTGGEVVTEVPGLSLGSGGAMWALVNVEQSGALSTVIRRHVGRCLRREVLPPGLEQLGEPRYFATDLAVDATSVYLVRPGIGVTRHEFMARTPCP